MLQILHGSTTTIEATRQAIQHSQESLRTLAVLKNIGLKTVTKWKKRTSVDSLPTGLSNPRSSFHRDLQLYGISHLPDIKEDR